jgi:diadenosine tetraphosphate (Ap4A) HIT family hydrolase
MHPHGMKRLNLLCATAMSGLTCFHFLLKPNTMMQGNSTPTELRIYHEPPHGVDYSTNPSVFGQILNGQLPSRTLKESTNLLAFEDRTPKANLHGLVIPKQFLESIFSLQLKDVQLVQEMRQMGLDLIQEQHPEAYASGDYKLCFHIPPFNSIDHLHLHVLAPASSMSFFHRYIKYQAPTRWCTSIAQVLERLQKGQPAVPFKQTPKIFPIR